jgi:hypothetical protein
VADPELCPREQPGCVSIPGSVVAKLAGDQQPDDVLSKRLHWQIPDAEILYRAAIPFLRFRDPLTRLFGSF